MSSPVSSKLEAGSWVKLEPLLQPDTIYLRLDLYGKREDEPNGVYAHPALRSPNSVWCFIVSNE